MWKGTFIFGIYNGLVHSVHRWVCTKMVAMAIMHCPSPEMVWLKKCILLIIAIVKLKQIDKQIDSLIMYKDVLAALNWKLHLSGHELDSLDGLLLMTHPVWTLDVMCVLHCLAINSKKACTCSHSSWEGPVALPNMIIENRVERWYCAM